VMAPERYAAWLAERRGRGEPALADRGEALFRRMGCSSCHAGDGARAPVLYGIFGKPVLLSDGRTIPADEAYLRESVVDPAAKIVSGYARIMPSYRGRLSEDELLD